MTVPAGDTRISVITRPPKARISWSSLPGRGSRSSCVSCHISCTYRTAGEPSKTRPTAVQEPLTVDTLSGPIKVRWARMSTSRRLESCRRSSTSSSRAEPFELFVSEAPLRPNRPQPTESTGRAGHTAAIGRNRGAAPRACERLALRRGQSRHSLSLPPQGSNTLLDGQIGAVDGGPLGGEWNGHVLCPKARLRNRWTAKTSRSRHGVVRKPIALAQAPDNRGRRS